MATRKKAAKKTTKKAAKPRKAVPRKAAPVFRGGTPCVCDIADDGMFYCFKKVQGRWVACSGPFASLEDCKGITGEMCG